MLDPWIIEEILRREEERKHEEGARIEMPLESPRYREGETKIGNKDDDTGRGVVVIDI